MTFEPATYRYGAERRPGEGLRIGVARHVPRGVLREDRPKRGYFDLWLPLLAPGAALVRQFAHEEMSFPAFSRHYRAEMRRLECRQVIELLAACSLRMPFSLGCFCEDENACHRSLLRRLILDARATLQRPAENELERRGIEGVERFASPVCFAHLEERGSLH